jgi:hypothetical protein
MSGIPSAINDSGAYLGAPVVLQYRNYATPKLPSTHTDRGSQAKRDTFLARRMLNRKSRYDGARRKNAPERALTAPPQKKDSS